MWIAEVSQGNNDTMLIYAGEEGNMINLMCIGKVHSSGLYTVNITGRWLGNDKVYFTRVSEDDENRSVRYYRERKARHKTCCLHNIGVCAKTVATRAGTFRVFEVTCAGIGVVAWGLASPTRESRPSIFEKCSASDQPKVPRPFQTPVWSVLMF